MADNQPIIHLFANEQFPRRLWIVKDAPYSWIKERFEYIDGRDIDSHSPEDGKAVTYAEVIHKPSQQYGILIVILDNDMTVSDMAHEATHFVLSLYQAIGEEISTQHQEVPAYLIGYATDCLYQVVKDEYRPMFEIGRAHV